MKPHYLRLWLKKLYFWKFFCRADHSTFLLHYWFITRLNNYQFLLKMFSLLHFLLDRSLCKTLKEIVIFALDAKQCNILLILEHFALKKFIDIDFLGCVSIFSNNIWSDFNSFGHNTRHFFHFCWTECWGQCWTNSFPTGA